MSGRVDKLVRMINAAEKRDREIAGLVRDQKRCYREITRLLFIINGKIEHDRAVELLKAANK